MKISNIVSNVHLSAVVVGRDVRRRVKTMLTGCSSKKKAGMGTYVESASATARITTAQLADVTMGDGFGMRI